MIALTLLAALSAPTTFPVQARLTDPVGGPIHGPRDVRAALYDAAEGGAALWEELHLAAHVDGGALSIELGAVEPLPDDLFGEDARWLELSIDGAPVGPRTRVLPVPIAHTGLGVAALPAPPVPCEAPAVGRLYFDTSASALRACDGTGWIDLGALDLGEGPSRAAPSCLAIHQDQPGAPSGPYWIDLGRGPVELYCDMRPGDAGWTLVGQVAGRHAMHADWLRSDTRVANLRTAEIEASTWASVDAIELAVSGATEVRLSNAAIDRWARWPLPAGRTAQALWSHAAGYTAINAAADVQITVTGHSGSGTCWSNPTGMMPLREHGGSYPGAFYNAAGNTTGSDWCMAVGVQLTGTTVDGFTQNGNGFDAPSNDTGWPNGSINIDPRVSVWLR